jgi:hypothetical protein
MQRTRADEDTSSSSPWRPVLDLLPPLRAIRRLLGPWTCSVAEASESWELRAEHTCNALAVLLTVVEVPHIVISR